MQLDMNSLMTAGQYFLFITGELLLLFAGISLTRSSSAFS